MTSRFTFELAEFQAACDECVELCIQCDDWLEKLISVVEEVSVLNAAMKDDTLNRDFVMSVFTDDETKKDRLEIVLDLNERLSEVLEQKREAERKRVSRSFVFFVF